MAGCNASRENHREITVSHLFLKYYLRPSVIIRVVYIYWYIVNDIYKALRPK